MSLDYSLVDTASQEEQDYVHCKDFLGAKLQIDLENISGQLSYYVEVIKDIFPMFEENPLRRSKHMTQLGLSKYFQKYPGLILNDKQEEITCGIQIGMEVAIAGFKNLYVLLCWRPLTTGYIDSDYIFYSYPKLNRHYRKKFFDMNYRFINKEFENSVNHFLNLSKI